MPDSIELQVSRRDGVGVLAVEGYINNVGGEKVAGACNEMIEEGVTRFALNLGGCRIVNSVGISFLIEILEKGKSLGGKVAFCCVTPTIGKTFRIMGLMQAATLHETEEDALKALS